MWQAAQGAANNGRSGATNGTANVTVVPAPPSDRYYAVYAVTVFNSTGGAVDVNLYLNDNGTVRQLGRAAALATLTAVNFLNVNTAIPVIVLRPGMSLEVDLDAAGAIPWYAAWGSPSLP